jgi:hypothetical protein
MDHVVRAVMQRIVAERKRSDAWFRANDQVPFSPAWDAAMADVEDIERELWRRGESRTRPEPMQATRTLASD